MKAEDILNAVANVDESWTDSSACAFYGITAKPRSRANRTFLRSASVAVVCLCAALAVGLVSASLFGLLPSGSSSGGPWNDPAASVSGTAVPPESGTTPPPGTSGEGANLTGSLPSDSDTARDPATDDVTSVPDDPATTTVPADITSSPETCSPEATTGEPAPSDPVEVTTADSPESVTATTHESGEITVPVQTEPVSGHVHSFSSVYEGFDRNYHWFVCSCGAKTGIGEHDLLPWMIEREATPGNPGKRTAICRICGNPVSEEYDYVETEPIPNPSGLSFRLREDSFYFVIGRGECRDSEIVIPAEYNGLPVTGILANSFAGQSDITSVVLPEGLITVGTGAFSGTGVTELTIPSTVETLGKDLFGANDRLTTLYIRTDKLTSESCKSPFGSCRTLTTVVFETATVSDYITKYLGIQNVLQTAVLTKAVKVIGNGAFSGCKKLKTVMYEGTFDAWCGISFKNSPCVNGSDLYIDGKLVEEIVFDEKCARADGEKAKFAGCTSLNRIIISANVSEIGTAEFYGCSALVNVIIPDSVASIGYNAFANCTSLEIVSFGEGVANVESRAFDNCNLLKYAFIPNPGCVVADNSFPEGTAVMIGGTD